MAEPTWSSPSASSSSSSSYREDSGAAASSSGSSSQVREEAEEQDHGYPQEHHFRNPEVENQHIDGLVSYRGNVATFDDSSIVIRDDTWSCIIMVLTFWLFVSMTLILGVYGVVNIRLGPNCSLLIQPNPIFVQSVKVEEIDDNKPGLKLYGFHKSPSLDVVTTWSETYTATVQVDSHKASLGFGFGSKYVFEFHFSDGVREWIYYLNRGSQVKISYNVNSAGSSVFLIIAQDILKQEFEGLSQFLENPTYPNITLSWNVVYDDWSVRLSYGPRWITYIVGIGGMSAVMLVAFNFLIKFQYSHEDETSVSYGSTRTPLLLSKDDDISSWGSSYDSVSSDEADLEDFLAGSVEGTSTRNGENSNNTRLLCAICFDAPRECFFLPCGHRAACYACGTRIAEAFGTCPICRRNTKKMRKIFTI